MVEMDENYNDNPKENLTVLPSTYTLYKLTWLFIVHSHKFTDL